MRSLVRFVGLALTPVALGGCQFLSLLGGNPLPSFDPNASYPFPSPLVTYTSGAATLTFENETIVLDQLVGSGTFDQDYGTDVTWTDGTGWYLSYYGLSSVPGVPDDPAYVSIDRVFDANHWIVGNAERCITTLTEPGPEEIGGTVICRGLRWSDYFGSFGLTGVPEYIDGEAAFDVEIAFEAR